MAIGENIEKTKRSTRMNKRTVENGRTSLVRIEEITEENRSKGFIQMHRSNKIINERQRRSRKKINEEQRKNVPI